MAETLIKVDLKQSPYENDMVHNRWHPDIPMVCVGQARRRLQDRDLRLDRRLHQEQRQRGRRARHRPDHGALPVRSDRRRRREPGDLLVVDILDIGAKPTACGASTASSRRRTAAAS
jgi:formamidase